MTTSQNIYAIKDRAPEFPCWVWTQPARKAAFWQRVHAERLFDADRFGGRPCVCTHWSPDAPEAPKAAPSLPASPGLPESVRQAIHRALFGEVPYSGWWAQQTDNIVAALTPLWPSATVKDARVCYADGDRCHGCDHYHGKADKCQYHPDRLVPTPSPVAGLPTPERIAQLEGLLKAVQFQRDESDKALAAARAEVEQWDKRFTTLWKTNEILSGREDSLRAQLATAKEEAERYRIAGLQESDRLLTALDDLAKANAAVEEAKADELSWRNGYTELANIIAPGNSSPTAVLGVAKQLAAQQSVPPADSKYVSVKPGADVSGMESDGASYTFKPDSK